MSYQRVSLQQCLVTAILTSSSLQQIPTSPRAQTGSKMAHVMTGLQTITDVPIFQLSPRLQVRGYPRHS